MRDLKLMQLTAPQLRRLRFTISARLNEKRKASGDTIHDMRTKAGVKCQCAKCSRPVSSTKYLAPVSGPAELVADPF